jgi:hypothetical protein
MLHIYLLGLAIFCFVSSLSRLRRQLTPCFLLTSYYPLSKFIDCLFEQLVLLFHRFYLTNTAMNFVQLNKHFILKMDSA